MKPLIAVLLSLAALLVGGCADTKEGKRYPYDLGSLIQRADRIEVIEHSLRV
ncbi:hypothetical protein LJR066_003134 [Acidovorax sp. LjRoot66]|uniref:hypothetical protein n=1 Tax=Acidovorax sp. LjRoot66 TaxID=3342334 RepID=UPI003ECFB9C7